MLKKNNRSSLVLVPVILVGALGLVTMATCGRSDLDAPAPVDAGTTVEGGTGGLPELPPTPGFLLCGSQICSAPSQQCCLGVSAAGTLAASCASAGAACAGASLQCDEPADCRSANVCCFGLLSSSSSSPAVSTAAPALGAGLVIGSRCEARSSCLGVGRLILCRKDSDCGPGGGVCCPGVGVPTCQTSCLGG